MQGSAKRRALGCVNSTPVAKGNREGGITQPGAHLLAVPCMPDRLLATNSNCRNCDFQLERVTCHRFYRRVSNLVYSSGSAATATGDRPTSKKAFFAPANYVYSLGSHLSIATDGAAVAGTWQSQVTSIYFSGSLPFVVVILVLPWGDGRRLAFSLSGGGERSLQLFGRLAA